MWPRPLGTRPPRQPKAPLPHQFQRLLEMVAGHPMATQPRLQQREVGPCILRRCVFGVAKISPDRIALATAWVRLLAPSAARITFCKSCTHCALGAEEESRNPFGVKTVRQKPKQVKNHDC